MIPIQFNKTISSMVANHPDWEYWFWSDALAEEFVRKRFPNYLHMYKNYPKAINRADAIRYFILYEFGGVYADIDMQSLRPLDELLDFHTFLIPEDHPVHTNVVFHLNRIPLNALMMSVPKHPIIKSVILHLAEFAKQKNVLWVAGPMMFENVLTKYEKTLASRTNVSLCDSIYLADWQQFIPQHSKNPPDIKFFRNKCKRIHTPKHREQCVILKQRKFIPKPIPPSAYTTHMFAHVHISKVKKKIPLKNIVGNLLTNVTHKIVNLKARDL
ncbi:uncharacterized protein LOC141902591 [Tubulanus polymorphus]|uniref:uncharacterized protein LOC141902591 n=1 Tax=Tubulanus polymorphus TaxID=672921 RepID=UPI003DA1F72F